MTSRSNPQTTIFAAIFCFLSSQAFAAPILYSDIDATTGQPSIEFHVGDEICIQGKLWYEVEVNHTQHSTTLQAAKYLDSGNQIACDEKDNLFVIDPAKAK